MNAPAAASRRTSPRRRRTVAVVALTAVVAALSACSSQPAGTGGGGTTTIKVYGWKGGGTELANVAQVNAAFEKANPGITVDFQYIPANDVYTQRVQPELLAGKSADVIMTDSSKVDTWGSAGYLEDLSGQPWKRSVLPAVQPFTSMKGKTYALPMEVIGIDLYANMSLLKKAGVTTAPTTWPEFLDALQKAKDEGITPIALPNKAGWTAEATLNAIAATLVYQKNKAWDADFLAGKATFADWQSSLDQLQELQSKGFVDFKQQLGVDEWGQGLPNFTSGKSAFWVQGAWNQAAVAKAGVDNVFIPWPAGADSSVKPTANLFTGTMWSVNARSSVKSAAEKYVAYWADSTHAQPYLAAENASSPFADGATPSTDATKGFVDTVASGNYRILPSNSWFDVTNETKMQKQMQALWLGQITDAEFLKSMDALR